VWLILAHPEIAGRPCEECKQWLYQDTAERLSGRKLVTGDGRPMPRPPAGRPGVLTTPCRQCPKIPPGVEPRPEHAVELSERNQQAYWHYLRSKAVGRFPRDPIVERNAGLIRMVEDEVSREREAAQIGVLELLPLLALGGGRR